MIEIINKIIIVASSWLFILLYKWRCWIKIPFLLCCCCCHRCCCCCSINSEPKSFSWSQWLHGLRRGSAAPCLPGLGVQIPSEAWMSLSYECCVLSGRGLIYRSPTECGVPERDHEAPIARRPWSTRGYCAMEQGGGGGWTRLDLSLDMLPFLYSSVTTADSNNLTVLTDTSQFLLPLNPV